MLLMPMPTAKKNSASFSCNGVRVGGLAVVAGKPPYLDRVLFKVRVGHKHWTVGVAVCPNASRRAAPVHQQGGRDQDGKKHSPERGECQEATGSGCKTAPGWARKAAGRHHPGMKGCSISSDARYHGVVGRIE